MKILEFENKNLKVTWTLLLICFNSNNLLKNCKYEQKFITENEILEYASTLLNLADNTNIVSLAILKERDSEKIFQLLKQLSFEERRDYGFEFRKFRAMYVYMNLPYDESDFINGILKISEIWDKFNFPEDSPNIYFEFKDYSKEKFKQLLEINFNWVLDEFQELI